MRAFFYPGTLTISPRDPRQDIRNQLLLRRHQQAQHLVVYQCFRMSNGATSTIDLLHHISKLLRPFPAYLCPLMENHVG